MTTRRVERRDQLLHHAPLVGVRLAQDGVERGDDRHSQLAQQRQHVAAGGPAEDPELVLHADDVHVADVEEVRRALVGRQILLLDLEANDVRIVVAALDVVDRHRETLALRMLAATAVSRSDVNVAMPHLRGK